MHHTVKERNKLKKALKDVFKNEFMCGSCLSAVL